MPGNVERSRPDAARGRLVSAIPAPLRRARFRQLWLGMVSSYDRFGLAALVGGVTVLACCRS